MFGRDQPGRRVPPSPLAAPLLRDHRKTITVLDNGRSVDVSWDGFPCEWAPAAPFYPLCVSAVCILARPRASNRAAAARVVHAASAAVPTAMS